MSGEVPNHAGEGFVAPKSEEELNKIDHDNMNFEQRHASYVRGKTHKVYGEEAPTMEFTHPGDGINSGIFRGTLKGVELELRRRHLGSEKERDPKYPMMFTDRTKDIYEYSGTMGGEPLQPKDAERLFDHVSSASTKEYLEKSKREAAESIMPKEQPVDTYQQTLDALLSNSKTEE